MHRKPNRVEGGPVFDWLTVMLRPVSHMNRSPVPIPSAELSFSWFDDDILSRRRKGNHVFINSFMSGDLD